MKNSADLGGCYPKRPKASQPHSIIANYNMLYKYGKHTRYFWRRFISL